MPFLSPDLPEALYSGPHDFLSKSCCLYFGPAKLTSEWSDDCPLRAGPRVNMSWQGVLLPTRNLFSDKSNCRRHVKETHQKMSQYACPFCSKVFHRSKIQWHMSQCQGQWMLSMVFSEIHFHFWPGIYFPCFIHLFRCWWSCNKNSHWVCMWVLQEGVCERVQLQKTCERNTFEHGPIFMPIL